MFLALRIGPPHPASASGLRTWHPAPGAVYLARRTWHSAFGTVHLALRIRHFAPDTAHPASAPAARACLARPCHAPVLRTDTYPIQSRAVLEARP